jgi:NADH dehydrogenase [ubiquinone] 1 alpha subcomplex assembly factor 1
MLSHMLLTRKLQIPFTNFVRTSAGELADTQASMYREKVKSIGISILGGNSGASGQYELGIESIRAVNESDVTAEPVQCKSLLNFHSIQTR